MIVILIFLDVLNEAALISALGASTFIVFTMPTRYSSDPRRLIGGYIVGLFIGFVFYLISTLNIMTNFFSYENTSLIVFGSIAVGFSIFVMAVTNTEHAPAAGIALGLVINRWDFLTILFIIIAVFWLVVIQIILKKYLMDLISPHVNPSK
jgi:CBS-domain-containing membrane protein